MEQRPAVGISVAVIKDGKVLLGKRLKPIGFGLKQFPGGHLEMYQSFADCARAECREEAGIELGDEIRIVGFRNNPYPEHDKHYVTFWVAAQWRSGEPQNLEPDKCGGWDWYDIDNFPHDMFETDQNILDGIRMQSKMFAYKAKDPTANDFTQFIMTIMET